MYIMSGIPNLEVIRYLEDYTKRFFNSTEKYRSSVDNLRDDFDGLSKNTSLLTRGLNKDRKEIEKQIENHAELNKALKDLQKQHKKYGKLNIQQGDAAKNFVDVIDTLKNSGVSVDAALVRLAKRINRGIDVKPQQRTWDNMTKITNDKARELFVEHDKLMRHHTRESVEGFVDVIKKTSNNLFSFRGALGTATAAIALWSSQLGDAKKTAGSTFSYWDDLFGVKLADNVVDFTSIMGESTQTISDHYNKSRMVINKMAELGNIDIFGPGGKGQAINNAFNILGSPQHGLPALSSQMYMLTDDFNKGNAILFDFFQRMKGMEMIDTGEEFQDNMNEIMANVRSTSSITGMQTEKLFEHLGTVLEANKVQLASMDKIRKKTFVAELSRDMLLEAQMGRLDEATLQFTKRLLEKKETAKETYQKAAYTQQAFDTLGIGGGGFMAKFLRMSKAEQIQPENQKEFERIANGFIQYVEKSEMQLGANSPVRYMIDVLKGNMGDVYDLLKAGSSVGTKGNAVSDKQVKGAVDESVRVLETGFATSNTLLEEIKRFVDNNLPKIKTDINMLLGLAGVWAAGSMIKNIVGVAGTAAGAAEAAAASAAAGVGASGALAKSVGVLGSLVTKAGAVFGAAGVGVAAYTGTKALMEASGADIKLVDILEKVTGTEADRKKAQVRSDKMVQEAIERGKKKRLETYGTVQPVAVSPNAKAQPSVNEQSKLTPPEASTASANTPTVEEYQAEQKRIQEAQKKLLEEQLNATKDLNKSIKDQTDQQKKLHEDAQSKLDDMKTKELLKNSSSATAPANAG